MEHLQRQTIGGNPDELPFSLTEHAAVLPTDPKSEKYRGLHDPKTTVTSMPEPSRSNEAEDKKTDELPEQDREEDLGEEPTGGVGEVPPKKLTEEVRVPKAVNPEDIIRQIDDLRTNQGLDVVPLHDEDGVVRGWTTDLNK